MFKLVVSLHNVAFIISDNSSAQFSKLQYQLAGRIAFSNFSTFSYLFLWKMMKTNDRDRNILSEIINQKKRVLWLDLQYATTSCGVGGCDKFPNWTFTVISLQSSTTFSYLQTFDMQFLPSCLSHSRLH